MAKCVAIAVQAQINAESEEELARVGSILKALFEGGAREMRIGGLFEISETADHARPKTIRRPSTKALPAPKATKSPHGNRSSSGQSSADIALRALEASHPKPIKPPEILPAILKAGLSAGSAYAAMYALVKANKVKRYADGSYKLTHAPSPANEKVNPASNQDDSRGKPRERVLDAVRKIIVASKAQGASHVSRAELYERLEAARPGTVIQSLDLAMNMLINEKLVTRVSAGAYSIA